VILKPNPPSMAWKLRWNRHWGPGRRRKQRRWWGCWPCGPRPLAARNPTLAVGFVRAAWTPSPHCRLRFHTTPGH